MRKAKKRRIWRLHHFGIFVLNELTVLTFGMIPDCFLLFVGCRHRFDRNRKSIEINTSEHDSQNPEYSKNSSNYPHHQLTWLI